MPIFQKDNTDNSEDYDKEQSSSSLYLHKKQKPQLDQQPPASQQISQQPPDLTSLASQLQQSQQQQNQQIQPQLPQAQQMNVQKKIKRVQFQDNVNIINDDNLSQQHELNLSKTAGATNDNNAQDHSISSTIDGSVTSDESNNTTEILDCRIEEKIKSELEEKQLQQKQLIESGRCGTAMGGGRYDEAPTPPPPITSSLIDKDHETTDEDEEEEPSDVLRPMIHKRRFYDIRKAPTILEVKINDGMPGSNQDKSVFDFKDEDDDDDCEEGRLEINSEFMIRDRKNKKPYKSKVCLACNTKHGKEICPIRNPIGSIMNPIDYNDWVKEHPEPPPPPLPPIDNSEDEKMFIDESFKSDNEMEDDPDDGEDITDDLNDEDLENKQMLMHNEENDDIITFADISVPKEFELLPSNINPKAKKSVYTKFPIPKYTQIGPLIGELTREVDIPDDCNMTHIFEIHDSILSKSIYYNMENKNKSNWLRYLQPARARDQRNLTMVKVDDKIYFVSCMDINVGCELLYWSDEVNSAWGKKKIEKTSKCREAFQWN